MAKAFKVARDYLATVSFILSVSAIVLALGLAYRDNQRTADNLHDAKVLRCLDAREGKGRTLKIFDKLRDLDLRVNGHISPATLELLASVDDQFRTLRACKELGISSRAVYPTTNGRNP